MGFFALELAAPTMKARTASTIVVKFAKLPEDRNRLSYTVATTGEGSQSARKSCDARLSECTVAGLLPGRLYSITVASCIKGVLPSVCSVASNVTTIRTLPQGT